MSEQVKQPKSFKESTEAEIKRLEDDIAGGKYSRTFERSQRKKLKSLREHFELMDKKGWLD